MYLTLVDSDGFRLVQYTNEHGKVTYTLYLVPAHFGIARVQFGIYQDEEKARQVMADIAAKYDTRDAFNGYCARLAGDCINRTLA